MDQVTTIGLDIAKNVFQAHGINEAGAVVIRRQLRRSQVLPFFKKQPPCRVGIEACATAHHWAREIAALGHEVKLMPAKYVKAYVKRNKNDSADAEAICEAVTRPTMRFVEIKTPDQQALLMLHRTRRLLIRQRIALVNAIRAHLAEFGIVAGGGRNGVNRLLKLIEADDDRIPAPARDCLLALRDQLSLARQQIVEADKRILACHRENELSRRLEEIPGVGPLIATALVASVPDPRAFKSARDLPAWIGLVPKQSSTGGKERLGHISKAGNRYLRSLLMIGAFSLIKRTKLGHGAHRPWLAELMARRPTKVAAIALANKIARIAWALMTKGTRYREPTPQAA
jgi:transposase